ncbi:hypothetical protein AB0E44_12685 [Micrococcus terreus]|uniref:sunset domain-containing protein n=1 Tax=Micrococcus terreus TaxID=574650 RepID=UPI0033EACA1B
MVPSAVPAFAATPSAPSAAPSQALTVTTPEVVGNAVVGQLLSLAGELDPTSQIQWMRDGVPLSGATGADYRLVLEDTCSIISARITQNGFAADTNGVGPVQILESQLTRPVVQGQAALGKTLTAVPGPMPSGSTIHYQWLRDGVEIIGATQPTYTLGVTDVNRSITVQISGSRGGCTIPAVASAAGASSVVAAGVLIGPDPTVAGTTRVGQTLTVLRGTWPIGTALRQQWLRNGAPITGATGYKYTLTAADRGARIAVRVTASKPGHADVTKLTPATVAVSPGVLTGPNPTIAGATRVGQTLTVLRGTWPTGTALRQQWLRNGAPITGATGYKYTLTAADRGARIAVRVTASKTGYDNVTKLTPRTAVISLGTLTAPAPKISGTVRVGQTLTALRGTWTSGTTLRQQWLRNGVPITGATSPKYMLTAADRGKYISVRVTGSKAGYTTVTTVSSRTGAVALGVLTAPTPKLSGTARAGYTVSAARGTWTSGTTLRQQWLRNGVAIPGATGTSYRLTSADVGRNISVRVTGSKAGYGTVARTSAAVRVATQTPPTSTGSCPAAYPIKGNANSGIYHVPGGAYYAVTRAEECFATRAAAEAAGYRASKR